MCECDAGDNMPVAYREETRRAAKDHACYECDGGIAKGDFYVHCSGIWDGAPDSYKWCHDCATIQRLASGLFRDFCFTFGELRACAEEAIRTPSGESPWETI